MLVFASYRNGWTIVGETLDITPAGMLPSPQFMEHLGAVPEGIAVEINRESRLPRIMVRKKTGGVVVIPISHDVVVFEGDPDGLGQRDSSSENTNSPGGQAGV